MSLWPNLGADSERDNMKLVLEDDAEEDRERKMRIVIDKVGTER